MTELVHIWCNLLYLVWLLSFGVCLGNHRDVLFSLFTRRTAFPSHLSSPPRTILLQAPRPILGGSPWLPFICHTSAVRSVLWEIRDEWHWKESHQCNSMYTAHPEIAADRWLNCSQLCSCTGRAHRAEPVYTQAQCFQMGPPGLQSCESSLTISCAFYRHYLTVAEWRLRDLQYSKQLQTIFYLFFFKWEEGEERLCCKNFSTRSNSWKRGEGCTEIYLPPLHIHPAWPAILQVWAFGVSRRELFQWLLLLLKLVSVTHN